MPPGQIGGMLPKLSLPAKTALLARESDWPLRNPVQTRNEIAQQNTITPLIEPTEHHTHTKQELDIKVKPLPLPKIEPMDQDDQNPSADEDKQDKWDLVRLPHSNPSIKLTSDFSST